MYRLVGIGALAIIIGLGLYFNFPHDGKAQNTTIAPELVGITSYMNTIHNQPITLAQLHGKVVLLHFFRIGCPECNDDASYINGLYSSYAPYGLVILGIQSPQFSYEYDQGQVQQWASQHQVKFPILMDTKRLSFSEYGDQYWPRDVLVSKSGYEVYSHIGTGGDLANQIQSQLAQKNY